jgi:nucleotide-binding universal stress UspA family protein
MSSFRDGTDGVDGRPPWLLLTPDRAVRRPRGEIRRVGCGIDGGEASAFALQMAARVAGSLDAELEVIRAIATPASVIDPALSEELAAAALLQLRHALASLPENVAAQGLVVQDNDPVRGLASRSDACELLVLGTRSGSPRGVAVLGTVSTRLAEEARCPVLVVPLSIEMPAAQLLNAWL